MTRLPTRWLVILMVVLLGAAVYMSYRTERAKRAPKKKAPVDLTAQTMRMAMRRAHARERQFLEEAGMLNRMPEELSDGRPIENSLGFDVNVHRQVVGHCWIPDGSGIEDQRAFLWDAVKGSVTLVPIPTALAGEPPFTNLEVSAIADNGLVACTARRPVREGSPFPGGMAYVWDSGSGMFTRLPLPEGRQASGLYDVSSNGTVVVGRALGSNKIRACVWEKEGDVWRVTELPDPHTASYAFGISPNGRYVAGKSPFTDPGPIFIPIRWEKMPDGTWERKELSQNAGIAWDSSDDGATVGTFTPSGEFPGSVDRAFLYDTGQFRDLGMLPDHYAAQAYSTANGFVIGISKEKPFPDGTAGRDRAFVYGEHGMNPMFVDDTTGARRIHPSGIIVGEYAEHRDDPEDERDRAFIYMPPFLKP